MQILSYPFKQKAIIQIENNSQIQQLDCELATTDVEIFQSLNFRKKEEFIKPLVLVFENPFAQSFSRINFSFPVEQIAVEHRSNIVKEITVIYPENKKEGNFSLQSYNNYGLVLLVNKGACKQHNIQLEKTQIALS